MGHEGPGWRPRHGIPGPIDIPENAAALQRRWAAARSATVRLVCFGDIHMAFQAIERLGPTLREADWAIRPLLASESWPPKLFNTAYYKNDKVDNDIKAALATTDKTEKAKFYKDAQETIWKDAPWAPLVTERTLSAHNKKLTGVYVMPDQSFEFSQVDLKQ